MKKIFLIFIIMITISACSNKSNMDFSEKNIEYTEKQESLIVKKYHKQLKQCDDTANRKSKNLAYSSTIGINRVIAEQVECYKNIAYQIIDQDYKKNAIEMKKSLDDYIRISGDITSDILRPDYCYPNCGSIVGLHSISSSLEHTRKYLDMLINSDKYWGEQQN